MTAPSLDMESKPRSWWIWGFAFVFLGHAALVFWLGDRTRARPFGSRPEPFVYVAATPDGQQRLSERIIVNDPTIFALPNPAGFSGGAWLNYSAETEQSPDWTQPPLWLSMPLRDLGDAVGLVSETNQPQEEILLASLRAYAPVVLKSRVEPIITESRFVVRGPLAARRLIRPVSPPSASHVELLAPTSVEVAVNGEGIVEAATVLAESGLKSMDETALHLARELRFQPLSLPTREREAAPLTRGRLLFTWHVVPPGATNTASASPGAAR